MNKRVLLLIISIIVVIFILTTTTYAFFYNTDRLANSEDYTTGILDIEVDTTSSGLGNTLTLNNAIPMSDNDGMNTTPYRFKLTNVGNLDYKFDLNFTKSGTINGNYVKLAVDDNEPITLPNTTTTILDDIVLFAGESKTISIRIWLDENTPNTEMTKTFSGTLNGTGVGQVYPTLAEKVISLSQGDTWKNGASGVYETNDHEYRYVGANVHNYVLFNSDMYRIIGVFDDNSHGQTGQWLVKLIAANPLGAYSWGVTNTAPEYTTFSISSNNWETASANILLNEYWLNATDTSSTYKSCSDWTYYGGNNDFKTKDCSDIIGYGIQTTNLRNYIQPVTWYLKGYDSTSYSKQNFYTCERSDTTTVENCNSGNSGDYATKVENKSIGLMYVSDYLYASGYYASTSTTTANSSYAFQNWLDKGEEWTITPLGSKKTYVFHLEGGGIKGTEFTTRYAYIAFAIRPTFYLKSAIKIKSGSGTFTSPFIIG